MRPPEAEPPRLSDEGRWYTEHTALVVTTLKWALLGAVAGVCVGWGTSVLAAAANTPIAAAVMGMEMLPHGLGVYAALCAGTAFLMVGHRSVYASQKLGLSKSAGLEVPIDVPIGEIGPAEMRVRKGSLTESVLDGLRRGRQKLRRR